MVVIHTIHSSELFAADQDKAYYKCRLQYVQGNSNKFYEVEYSPMTNEYSTTYGRVGSKGRRTVVRSYFDIQKKIQEKLNKGYRDTMSAGSYKTQHTSNANPSKYKGDEIEGLDDIEYCRVYLTDVDTSRMILTLKTLRALGSMDGIEMSLREAKEIWQKVLKSGMPAQVCRYAEWHQVASYIHSNKWSGRYRVENASEERKVHWKQPMFAHVSYIREMKSGAWVAYTKDHENLMTIPYATLCTLEGWRT